MPQQRTLSGTVWSSQRYAITWTDNEIRNLQSIPGVVVPAFGDGTRLYHTSLESQQVVTVNGLRVYRDRVVLSDEGYRPTFYGSTALGRIPRSLAHGTRLVGPAAVLARDTGGIDLMEDLTRAREQGGLKRRLTWLRKPHIILVDEVGYEELTKEQANLFFQVVNARYEHGSMILTTNRAFGRWAEILNDEAIATATLDRLLHHAHVFSLKGDSYRMKDRKAVVQAIEDQSENEKIALSHGNTPRVELDLFHKTSPGRFPDDQESPSADQLQALIDKIDLSFLSEIEK